MDDPYHEGSRAVQDRLGVRAVADHIGRSIGPGLREVTAAFLGLQRLPRLRPGALAERTLLGGLPG
ncbi:hypothetical protein ACWIG5_02595 [Streptomyces lydicus]